jgi:hypothetical protein
MAGARLLNIVMTLAWGKVYDSHKYPLPPFSSLYPTDVTFENPLVNIEILGTSEGGGK